MLVLEIAAAIVLAVLVLRCLPLLIALAVLVAVFGISALALFGVFLGAWQLFDPSAGAWEFLFTAWGTVVLLAVAGSTAWGIIKWLRGLPRLRQASERAKLAAQLKEWWQAFIPHGQAILLNATIVSVASLAAAWRSPEVAVGVGLGGVSCAWLLHNKIAEFFRARRERAITVDPNRPQTM